MPKARICSCSRAGALGVLYCNLRLMTTINLHRSFHQVGVYEDLVIMSSQIPELEQHRRGRACLITGDYQSEESG
jgi:hypothetical protein